MQSLEQIKATLNRIGFVGERKAVALGGLGFYATIFVFMGVLLGSPLQPPEVRAWAPTFLGLGGCYALGFFGLAADWFWGRWFATGLGSSGVSLVVWGVIMTRQLPEVLLIFGVVHGLVVLCLMGEQMAARYEGREDWRKRLQIDEQGVAKLRRSVTRAATSLPSLIVIALKPADDAADMLLVAVAASGAIGLFALLRGRAWGLVALGVAGIGAVSASMVATSVLGFAEVTHAPLPLGVVSLFAGALLLGAVAPFVRPLVSFLSARR